MSSPKPLQEHVPIDTEERKDGGGTGKEIVSSRSPEAETEKPRAPRKAQRVNILLQSDRSQGLGGRRCPVKVAGRVKDMVPFPEGALSDVSAGLRLVIWAPCLWHTLVLSQPAHVSVPEILQLGTVGGSVSVTSF